ncbi:MAG: hypothetical protein ACPGVI_01315 [Crocinitomicaceae bacterium]
MKITPIAIFIVTVVILGLVFFLFPINLFDGKIVYQEGLKDYTLDAPLSLSYFIGLGYDEADMVNVKSFYLTTKGIVMACIFLLGFPALLAFRVHLRNTNPSK